MNISKMKNEEIECYLRRRNRVLDNSILDLISENLTGAQDAQNEELADYYWYLEQIYNVQSTFIKAFDQLLNHEFENAWNSFDSVDIGLGIIDMNFPADQGMDLFNLAFIGRMVKEYQKLFPYRYFLSRESIIKQEKCNICGQVIKLRHPCGHIPGKVYMGKLCLREITEMDIQGIALVRDPFDKYAIIKIPDREYNYGMLEKLLKVINDPYDEFFVKVQKDIKPEYKNIGRNEPCPCGSGKKYKKCHLGSDDELLDHYIICKPRIKCNKVRESEYFNTWI